MDEPDEVIGQEIVLRIRLLDPGKIEYPDQPDLSLEECVRLRVEDLLSGLDATAEVTVESQYGDNFPP